VFRIASFFLRPPRTRLFVGILAGNAIPDAVPIRETIAIRVALAPIAMVSPLL